MSQNDSGDGSNKYYYNGPTLGEFQGFLNFVDTDKRRDDCLKLTIRLDVSHNRPSEERPDAAYTDKGVSPVLKLRVFKDHEMIALIDKLAEEGKIDGTQVEKGVKLFFRKANMKVHFWQWKKDGYDDPMLFVGGTLPRWARVGLTPSDVSDDASDGGVNDEPTTTLAPPDDF